MLLILLVPSNSNRDVTGSLHQPSHAHPLSTHCPHCPVSSRCRAFHAAAELITTCTRGIISVVVSLGRCALQKATPAATCSFLKQSRLGQGHLLRQGPASSLSLLHYILASCACAVILPLHFILLAPRHLYLHYYHLASSFQDSFPVSCAPPCTTDFFVCPPPRQSLLRPSNQPEHRSITYLPLRLECSQNNLLRAIFADVHCFRSTLMTLRPTQHYLQASSPPLPLPSR